MVNRRIDRQMNRTTSIKPDELDEMGQFNFGLDKLRAGNTEQAEKYLIFTDKTRPQIEEEANGILRMYKDLEDEEKAGRIRDFMKKHELKIEK